MRVPSIEEINAFNDAEARQLRAIIEPLCREHGYGRVMQLVSQWWREKDPVGAISLGPCYGELERKPLPKRGRK
jgi:hypothetical protein